MTTLSRQPIGASDFTDRLIPVRVAREALGISTTGVYGLLASGALPSFAIGNRKLIRAADLAGYLSRLPSTLVERVADARSA